MNFYLKVITFFCFLIISEKLFASVTVDSVLVQTSTCTNNGVAQVFAKSNPTGSLLYAITAGPILAPIQNSNVFSSLYPGSYNLRVYNVNFDSTDYQFQILGNYELPEFTLNGVDPTCPGFIDGSINVILDPSKGLAPFSYEIISPIVMPSQTTGFFPNLSSNTYFVRVTDACGNYQTRTEVLLNTGTALALNNFIIPSAVKIGCDTMMISTGIYLYKEKWTQPLQVTYNTPFGPITKFANLQVIDTFNNNPGFFQVVDTIVGLDYNDYLNIVFTDVCGVSVSSMMNQIAPFEFDLVFSPATVNCVATYSAYAQLKSYANYPYDYTYANAPFSFILTDVSTGVVVDSGTCSIEYCSLYLKPQATGVLYNMVVTDGCGDVWQSNIMWPNTGTPTVSVYTSYGCLDSTTVLTFACFDFQSIPTVTILSGPSFASSTKPFYAYNEAITYPQTFVAGVSVNTIYVKDFPVGTYNYIVQDSCGNNVQGTFTVEDYMVSNLSFSWHVKPSCLNNNTFYYNFGEGTGGAIYASITNIATNQVVATPAIGWLEDSITTFPIGNYALEIWYLNRQGYGGTYFDGGLVNSGVSCWGVHDTIVISPYTNSFFITNTTVYCNGNYYVALEVDSTRGVAPYKFAIINGPQTFPLQDSSFFQISTFGNYLISMEDACGNNYTQQISVTSDSFPPIVRGGYFCEGNFTSLSANSSPYFTNIWRYPNGNLFIGDSISFQPFSLADTGQYNVTTLVNINGCTDSLNSSFYLSGKDSVILNLKICPGDSISVGSKYYSLPGTYRDTLSTVLGCDSVLITNISFKVTQVDSNFVSICYGDSVSVGTNFYSLPGVYLDTVSVAGNCKKLVVTQLTVNNYVDSISATICQGDTFKVGNSMHFLAGMYIDTLTATNGCDSVIVLNLSFTPILVDSSLITICNGDSWSVGSNFYTTSGLYIDTIPTPGNCKKIVVTQLNVTTIIDSISAQICQGDSFMVGNMAHSSAGIFTDTLTAASGCDSLVVLNLTLTPLAVDSNVTSICFGDSLAVGLNYYSVSGLYKDTIDVPGSCKKIIVTQLSVNSYVDSVSAIICPGDSVVIGNNLYSSAGTFTDSLTSAFGCDSLVIINITYSQLLTDSNFVTICKGDTISVGPNYYYQTGLYVDTVTVSGNCKKLLITQLTVYSIIVCINSVICQGDSFLVGNVAYMSPGIYKDTLVTSTGCDSVIILNLSFSNLIVDSNAVTICSGDSISVGMNYYYQSGLYVDTVVVSGNCKKVIVTQLTVNTISNSISAVICQGESYVVGAYIHVTTGIYSDTLLSIAGCDSVVILNLLVVNGGTSTSSYTICFGDSLLFGNNYLYSSGLYTDTINAGNCDSIVYLQLVILAPIPVSIVANSTVATQDIPVSLSCIYDPMWSYLWSGNGVFENPNSNNTNVFIETTSWIYLSVTNALGCNFTDSILLYTEIDESKDSCDFSTVFIPNAFSPNNDGINDFFEVVSEYVNIENFIIFNRWGQLIFESSENEKRWNGYVNNDPSPSGVYVYLLEYLNCGDNKKRYRYGNITLLD